MEQGDLLEGIRQNHNEAKKKNDNVMTRNHNVIRYPLSTLIELRNEKRSQIIPAYVYGKNQNLPIWTYLRLRGDSKKLGLWKEKSSEFQYESNCKGNCRTVNGCRLNCNCSTCDLRSTTDLSESTSSSQRGVLGPYMQDSVVVSNNKRAVRTRERVLNYQWRICNDNGSSSISSSCQQNLTSSKAILDNRSISSAHLLPAFAKKHIGNISSFVSTHCNSVNNNAGASVNEDSKFLKLESGNSKMFGDSNQSFTKENTINPTSSLTCRMNKNEYYHNDNHTSFKISTESNVGKFVHKTNVVNHKRIDRRIGSGRLITSEVMPSQDFRHSTNMAKDKTGISHITNSIGNCHDIFSNSVIYNDSKTGTNNSRNTERRILGNSLTESGVHEKYEKDSIAKRNIKHNNENNIKSNNLKHCHLPSLYCETNTFLGQRSVSYRRNQRPTDKKDRLMKDKEFDKDEPEWFSSGPVSQHDTIELRGFVDELDEKESNYRNVNNENENLTTNLLLIKEGSTTDLIRNMSISTTATKANTITTMTELRHEKLSNTILPKNIEGHIQYNNNYKLNIESPHDTIHDNTNSNDMLYLMPHEPEVSKIQIQKLSDSNTDNSKKYAECQMNSLKGSNGLLDDILSFFDMDTPEYSLIVGNENVDTNDKVGASRFSRWFNKKDYGNNGNNKVDHEDKNEPNLLKMFFKNNKFISDQSQQQVLPHTALCVEELEAKMRSLDCNSALEVGSINKTNINCVKKSDQKNSKDVSHTELSPNKDFDAFQRLLDQLGSSVESKSEIVSSTNDLLSLNQSIPLLSPNSTERLNKSSNSIFSQSLSFQNQQSDNTQKAVQQQNYVERLQNQTFHPINTTILNDNLPILAPTSTSYIKSFPRNDNVTKQMLSRLQNDAENNIITYRNRENIKRQSESTFDNEGLLYNNNSQSNSKRSIILPTMLASPMEIFNSMNSATSVNKENKDLTVQEELHLEESICDPKNKLEDKNQQASTCKHYDGLYTHNKNDIVEQPESLNDEISKEQMKQLQHPISHMSNEINVMQHHQQHQQIKQLRMSPSPLAFTPTSVLRKMTADKDVQNNDTMQISQHYQPSPQWQPNAQATHSVQTQFKNYICNTAMTHCQTIQQQLHHQHIQQLQQTRLPQPRIILGGGGVQAQQPSQSHQQRRQLVQTQAVQPSSQCNQNQSIFKWHGTPMSTNLGRPILRGPMPSVAPHLQMQIPHFAQQVQCETKCTQQPTLSHSNNMELQFQQSNKGYVSSTQQSMQQHLNASYSQSTLPIPMAMNPQVNNDLIFQRQHQRTIALQQLQHNIHHDPIQKLHSIDVTAPSKMSTNLGPNGKVLISNMNHSQRDRCLSPTSNQLAQWFSPELLAQASAGKLPLLNISQAVSLEEFERNIQHSTAIVHN